PGSSKSTSRCAVATNVWRCNTARQPEYCLGIRCYLCRTPPPTSVAPSGKLHFGAQFDIRRGLSEAYVIGAWRDPPALTGFVERSEESRIDGDGQRGRGARRERDLRPAHQTLRCLPAAGLGPN